eukprot:gene21280-biopygen2641
MDRPISFPQFLATCARIARAAAPVPEHRQLGSEVNRSPGRAWQCCARHAG